MNVIPNEKEIVERLVRGDKDAFCELYAGYKRTVIHFCMRIVKSGEMAEDIFQDTFVVIWQSHRFINPELPFSAYLFTIVRNRVLNILREEENRQVMKSVITAKRQSEENTTNETVLLNDLLRLLAEAKSELTPKQLEVYELSREKHKSHSEIAELLQISKNTVREHITMALKQIRLYLEKHSDYLQVVFLLCLFNL